MIQSPVLKAIFVLTAILFSTIDALGSPGCEMVLAPAFAKEVAVAGRPPQDINEKFISYISELIENRSIGLSELYRWSDGLDQGFWLNPIDVKAANMSIHFQEVQKYLNSGQLKKKTIARWLKEQVDKLEVIEGQRSKVEADTIIPGLPMQFGKIEAGKFDFTGGLEESVQVELTRSFEMSTTPITQKQWFDVMGENPSENITGMDQVTVVINGRTITLNPDHPVTNVSWFSILEFANRLSKLHGLKPAYDMSKMKFEGRPEDGTLQALSGRLKIRSFRGNPYKARGYRLPTEVEWEFAATGRGSVSVQKFRQEVFESPEDPRTKRETINVGETTSVDIDGVAFSDFYGNISQFTQEVFGLWEEPNLESLQLGTVDHFGRVAPLIKADEYLVQDSEDFVDVLGRALMRLQLRSEKISKDIRPYYVLHRGSRDEFGKLEHRDPCRGAASHRETNHRAFGFRLVRTLGRGQ